MKKSILFLIPIILIIAGCVKDTLDLNKFSKTIQVEREQALPLVQGKLSFKDISGTKYHSFVVNIASGYIDTTFFYLLNNVNFHDTIKIGDIGGSNIDIDFIKLYHTFSNDFPVGLNVKVYLYDSVQAAIIDSIPLDTIPNTPFLPPAPVDANGLVDTSAVKTVTDVVDLSSVLANKLLHQATSVILNATIPTANTSSDSIGVRDYYSLSFKFGIDAKGKYKGQL